MDCYYCHQQNFSKTYIFDTPHWYVALANDQAYLGWSLIISKQHKNSISDLSAEEWVDLNLVMKKIESSYRTALGAEMFNWTCLINSFYKQNPADPHVHWHVRPRYRTSVKIGKYTFEDPEFGHHYSRDRKLPIADEIAQIIIKQIQSKLLPLDSNI